MDYTRYAASGCTIKEYYITMSDGVQLRIIDFTPKGDSRKSPMFVFVAGWISLISGWEGFLKSITAKYRTIYMDTREKNTSILPAHGKVSFTMDRLKLDLKESLEKIVPRDRHFILSGSSLGATVILEEQLIAKRKPLCTILISPIAVFRFPSFLGTVIPALHPSMYLIAKPVVKWYLRNFRLDKHKEPEQVKKYENTLDAADPYKLKPNALAIRNYHIWEKLPGISVPTLIIGAKSDTLHGTDTLNRMLELLPRAAYRELASNKETHSEACGGLIVDFIRRKEYLEI